MLSKFWPQWLLRSGLTLFISCFLCSIHTITLSLQIFACTFLFLETTTSLPTHSPLLHLVNSNISFLSELKYFLREAFSEIDLRVSSLPLPSTWHRFCFILLAPYFFPSKHLSPFIIMHILAQSFFNAFLKSLFIYFWNLYTQRGPQTYGPEIESPLLFQLRQPGTPMWSFNQGLFFHVNKCWNWFCPYCLTMNTIPSH